MKEAQKLQAQMEQLQAEVAKKKVEATAGGGMVTVGVNGTQEDPCRICREPRRGWRLLCVVEEPNDLLALDRTGEFRGRYHVLLGALSPLDGIGPEDLKVRELLSRLEREPVEEIILATNPSVEGEATAIYLGKLLKPFATRIT